MAKKEAIITETTASELDNVFDQKELEAEEKVEAALFIAGKFLNVQDLVVLTDINPIMLKEIIHRLERKYRSGAIRLISRNNCWKMDVAEKYHYLINRLATGTNEFTKAEQETLAVIAYKQPVKQSVIVNIRGNKAYEHIKKFRELGFLNVKRIAHTLELTLSEDFYEYFNVDKAKQQEEGEKIAEQAEQVAGEPSESSSSAVENEEKNGSA